MTKPRNPPKWQIVIAVLAALAFYPIGMLTHAAIEGRLTSILDDLKP